jgi:hypothetical protein
VSDQDPGGEPYRGTRRDELVVDGGASPSALLVVAGLLFVTLMLGRELGLSNWLAFVGVLAVLTLGVFATTRLARRNRFRFVLVQRVLRVERLLPRSAALLGEIDVSRGLRMRVEIPDDSPRMEARLALTAGDEELRFFPGACTRAVYTELAGFLRAREVELDAPSELPKLPMDGFRLP